MRIGYITNLGTPEIIGNCIHFQPSDASCDFQKYETISLLLDGISKGEIDFGVITEKAFRNYRIETAKTGKPPDQIRTIARFLIKETSKDKYILYSLLG